MPETKTVTDAPWQGAVPIAGGGVASVIRIPFPGKRGFAIQLTQRQFRGRAWQGRSTSSLFIQDQDGFHILRLDYGPNPSTKTIDYHWNQTSVFKDFGIADHTPAGRGAAAFYEGARAFRYLGRTLLVVGAVADLASIVVASNPLQRTAEVAGGWAGAWAGAEAGGVIGGVAASELPVLGTAAGGLVGAFIGGIAGYWGGERAGAFIYGWAADTTFTPLPEIPASDIHIRQNRAGAGVPAPGSAVPP